MVHSPLLSTPSGAAVLCSAGDATLFCPLPSEEWLQGSSEHTSGEQVEVGHNAFLGFQ